MKKTIGLLTDFGLDDNFVGVMKGVISSIHPEVQFIDICHNIAPQDVFQGALTLKSAYRYFPKDTIFLCVVDPGVGSQRRPLFVQSRDYTFIAPDNGLLTPVLELENGVRCFEITNDEYFLKPVSNTFHGRDVFSPIAALAAKGINPAEFGKPLKDVKKIATPKASINQKNRQISGEVIYIDRFGNLITNIEEKHLLLLRKKFSIIVNKKRITRLSKSYSEVKAGQPAALLGSMGYLEIAVNQGSASKKLKAKIKDKVKIQLK